MSLAWFNFKSRFHNQVKAAAILHLEDEPDLPSWSAACSIRMISRPTSSGCSEPAGVRAMHEAGGSSILSDYHLPSFTGLEALGIAKHKCPLTSRSILFSGTIGEQAAIERFGRPGRRIMCSSKNTERLPSAGPARRAGGAAKARQVRDAERS